MWVQSQGRRTSVGCWHCTAAQEEAAGTVYGKAQRMATEWTGTDPGTDPDTDSVRIAAVRDN